MRSSDYRSEMAPRYLKPLFSYPIHRVVHSLAIFVAALCFIPAINSSVSAATIVVPAGGSVQAAINAANCGDTIVLQGGATWVTPGLEVPVILLKNKPCSNDSWITIRTSDLNGLPGEGQRVTPAHVGVMAHLITNRSTPAIEAEPGANHYRLIGLEIRNDGSVINQGLVNIGPSSGSTPHPTFATVPRHIEFDRCYIHSIEDGTDSAYGTGVRGFNIAGSNITIRNSRIAGFRGWFPGTQTAISSNAVLLGAGPGPYTITNSYLEAWFVPLFTGGANQWITNRATVSNASLSQATLSNVNNLAVGDLIAFEVTGDPSFAYQVARVIAINGNTVSYVPQGSGDGGGNPLAIIPNVPGDAVWNGDVVKDVTITRNLFVLNPIVAQTIAAATGNFGKGFIELKIGKRIHIEGNIFEGPSMGWTFTTRNQTDGLTSGANPWATLEDITFRSNWRRVISNFHNSHLFGIQLQDNMATSLKGRNVVIENNLFEGSTSPVANIGGSDNVVFRNNTAVDLVGNPDVSMIFSYSPNNVGLVMEDNIFYNGEYGLNCILGGDVCWPGKMTARNVIIDNRSQGQKAYQGPLTNLYQGGNFFPNSVGEVGFVDKASGNWRLATNSPYKGLGFGGTDPGVNMDALLSALAGSAPSSPTPTPIATPTPTPTVTPMPTPTPTPVATPTPTPGIGSEVVWFDDALPAGAIAGGISENWSWVGASPPPYSGLLAHQSANTAGLHQHSFSGATESLTVSQGDVLFTYVYIDPVNPPSQVMVQWLTYEWEHRAYWGANKVTWGIDGTNSRRFMGALPSVGQWVRLEVPASQVGLEGKSIKGMTFTLYGGKATWDRSGKASALSPSPPSTKSSESVTRAKDKANSLVGMVGSDFVYAGASESSSSPDLTSITSDLDSLIKDIELAYADFLLERNLFGAIAERIETQLMASYYFSKANRALASKVGPTQSIRDHLRRIAAHLAITEDLMLFGAITPFVAERAMAANARTDLVFGPASAGYGSSESLIAPASLAFISGEVSVSPLSAQTLFAPLRSDGVLFYELGGVSVTVGGLPAPVVYVSPSKVSFCVPSDLPLGTAEVLVTSQSGHISRGTTTIAQYATRLFTLLGQDSGKALVVDALMQSMDEFDVFTNWNFGPDKRTRLAVFVSGMSGSAANSDPDNDIVENGVVKPNFAESVSVEARTSDGQLIMLPVEFAGLQGTLPGVDQVIFRLDSSLRGTGTVQLSVLAGGQRSNVGAITIK